MAETYELKVIQTRVLGSNLTAALAFNDETAAADVLATLENARDIVLARVLLGDGRVFAEYRNDLSPFAASSQRRPMGTLITRAVCITNSTARDLAGG